MPNDNRTPGQKFPNYLPPSIMLRMRARGLALRHFWRLLGASALLFAIQTLLSWGISNADYALFGHSTEISLLGNSYSLTYEAIYLVVLLLVVPLEIGVAGAYLAAGRNAKLPFRALFSWYTQKRKRRAVASYALLLGLFRLLMLPLSQLPLSMLQNAVNSVLEEAQSSLTAASSLTLPGREIGISLLLLLCYAMISVPFLATPYIFSDLGEKIGAWRCVRLSLRAMMEHMGSFLLLVLAFIPWMLAGSCLQVLLLYLMVYFRLTMACFADCARADCNRPRFFADGEPEAEEENQ